MSRRNDSSFDPEFLESLSGAKERRSGGRRQTGQRSRGEQKTRQLCRQAQRAVSLALAGGCGDDVLRSAYVESVVPAPDATHLLVRLVFPAASSSAGVRGDEVLARLQRVHGLLRRAVAEAVTRKRAPQLSFVIIPEAPHE